MGGEERGGEGGSPAPKEWGNQKGAVPKGGFPKGGRPKRAGCTFGLSGCRVKRPLGPGASHDSPRTPNVHISGPGASKHHQNSTKRPPREGRKSEHLLWEREKMRNFRGEGSGGGEGPEEGGPRRGRASKGVSKGASQGGSEASKGALKKVSPPSKFPFEVPLRSPLRSPPLPLRSPPLPLRSPPLPLRSPRARSTSANFDFGQLFFRVRPIRLREGGERGRERKQFGWGNQYSPCLCEGVAAEGRRRFHRNTAYARLSGFNRSSCGASPAIGRRST